MGPLCADRIPPVRRKHPASLAIQQLTSFGSRTFEYRSIEKQLYFRLLNPILTNVLTLLRLDSSAGMIPKRYSWPTALYLPLQTRWLAVHHSLGLQRVLAFTLLAVPLYFATLFIAYIRDNIQSSPIKDYGDSDIDVQTNNTYSIIEGNTIRYHTEHVMGADDDTLYVRY